MTLRIKRRGLMLVLSSPSGVGKTTLAHMILRVDKHIHSSVSVTTRAMRPGELDGVHYHFTDKQTFEEMIAKGEFLEYAKVYEEYYGTPKAFVEKHLTAGEDVLFDIDWQGNKESIKRAREDVVSIFIFPPSKAELLKRLKARNQDHSDIIEYRMGKVDDELSHWHEYDYSIINRDVDSSLKKVLSILRAERLKKNRRLGVKDFVAKLISEKI